jgi:hypothetical protein
VSFGRLSAGHVVAALAALALMFVMALDWYTTAQGREFRDIERQAGEVEAERDEIQQIEREAGAAAEAEERNAWQEEGLIDRVILVMLLATVAAAIGAAMLRAAGRSSGAELGVSAVVAGLALIGEALVAYRIVQEPGLDNSTEVTAGPPLALGCLAVISLAAFAAMRAEEREEPAAGEPPGEEPPVAGSGDAEPRAT